MPAALTRPPGTVSSNGNAPAPPATEPSTQAASMRSGGSTAAKRSRRSSLGVAPKKCQIGEIASFSSSRDVQGRTSIAMKASLAVGPLLANRRADVAERGGHERHSFVRLAFPTHAGSTTRLDRGGATRGGPPRGNEPEGRCRRAHDPGKIRLRDLLERRVLEHQAPLGAVLGEADRDDATRLDAGDDSLAERAVPHRVADRERGRVRPRRHDSAGSVARPGSRPQTLALDLVGKLVEKARGQVVVAASVQRAAGRVRQRQVLLRTRHAHVAEAPLLLELLLLERARVREDALLHPD